MKFFGSRHGKGEADGESAVVKTFLDLAVKSQQLTLQTAIDCYELLQSSTLSTPSTTNTQRHFYYLDHVLIDCERESATQPVPIPNVRKIHQVISDGNGTLKHRRLSCFCISDCSHISWDSFTYPGN